MAKMPHRNKFDLIQLDTLTCCPWCKGNDAISLFVEKGWPYVQCCNCKLIYLSTRIKEEYVHLLYDQDEYHDSSNLRWLANNGEKRLALLGNINQEAVIFEDGAGSGSFIAACLKRNYKASGCDLGLDAIKQAHEIFGVSIHNNTLIGMSLGSSSVDYLVSFNLMSHLYQPWNYLKECRRVLKDNGTLLIRTGDRTGPMRDIGWGHWSAPEHVFHFPRDTFSNMLEEAGLCIVTRIPAFDSDYPYWLFNLRKHNKASILREPINFFVRFIYWCWIVLRLPKDDVFYIIKCK